MEFPQVSLQFYEAVHLILSHIHPGHSEDVSVLFLLLPVSLCFQRYARLMEIKGIGLITVSGFLAEVGDIKRFDNPKQLQKLAGYAIVADQSGKHNGESRIS